MNKKGLIGRATAVALGSVMTVGALGLVTGCKKSTDQLVIMSEPMDGLFNPFFATSGPDMDVVGMTQLAMLTTDEDGHITYGEKEATAVLDYKNEYDPNAGTTGEGVTTHYFVLKNGLTFSDGEPLTIHDVLFNLYTYLDPVYTGSTTIYSTDIVGLSRYRTQNDFSGGSADDAIGREANKRAQNRILELLAVYEDANRKLNGSGASSYDVSEADMKAAIAEHAVSVGFKEAVSEKDLSDAEYRAILLSDYETTLTTFKEELNSDYVSAKESYSEEPYKSTDEFDEITSFMYMEGFVEVKYAQTAGSTADKSKIERVIRNYPNAKDGHANPITTKEAAINHVYNSKVSTALHEILQFWGTANTMATDFVAKATEVILHEQIGEGGLNYPTISGIVSMGHTTSETSITIGNNVYNIASASEYDEKGVVTASDKYAVLRVQINGVDPKAIWNFSFNVAPYHYYSDPETYGVNIASDPMSKENSFGVGWGSYEFMKNVIQGNNSYGASKNKVPLGAGAYKASDRDNRDKPAGNAFNNNNMVFFKANDDFLLGAPKIKKIVYQEVSATNALDVLNSGSVHFVTPQFTKENKDAIDKLGSKGIESVPTWQLGYGYIGINAGKVRDINLRRAIMSAMDTSLVERFYSAGTVTTIAWPMSVVSWAYPRDPVGSFDGGKPLDHMDTNNGFDYTMYPTGADADEKAKEKIRGYMSKGGYAAGDAALKMKFTIAGSNLTDHPVYAVFEKAAELLKACGWEVDVVPDTNALTKLATGSLTVWAAAWGSTIDPDMYQVYHKDSTATSVLNWGYREILNNPGQYTEETRILNSLSQKIDDARKTDVESERAAIYKDAMKYVLELAVEMPAYQRQTLYAYNANVIDTSTFPEKINSYSSPIGKIWEIDFKK